MGIKIGRIVVCGVAAVAIAMPALSAATAMASTGGVHFAFPQPPIAPAGSIPAGGSLSFTLRVTNNGAADPGVTAYLCQCQDSPGVGDSVPGDSTTVPAAQCGGVGVLPSDGSLLACTTDSLGQVVLTYHVPAQTVAQGRADWIAVSDTTSHPARKALQHYVYCTVYRFNSSPIANSGSLASSVSVPVTLTAEDGVDTGIASTTFLSFHATSGGGSASVGGTQLTSTPALFSTNSNGSLAITYTTPASPPASGQDVVTVSDAKTGSTERNSDTYSFAAGTPVISIGDVNLVEGDQKDINNHGITAEFTVTISPAQPNPMTLDYQTLCGVGDKGCGEDFIQVNNPTPFTIPANANTTILPIIQFSYVGGNAGETYNEGWYMELSNPSVGVVGRSVGEGILLPDVEDSTTPVPDLYIGDVGLAPITNPGMVPMYFVVTLGAQETSTVTFDYTTSDGTAIAGADFVAASGVGSIPPGATSAIITVNLLSNTPPANNETFTLTISNASGGLTIARATGTGTVLGGRVGTTGPPAQLAFTPSPAHAARNAPLSPQPAVSVEDGSGNVVSTDSSHVTISLNGPGTLTCTGTGLTVQAFHGVATFSGCSVDTVANGDTLTAADSDDSLPSVTSGSFNVTAAFTQAPYTAVTPFRVCDTRPVATGIASNQCNSGSPSGPITNNSTRAVKVTGGVVPSTATAIVVNLSAIAPTARTLLAVYPTGGTRGVSNVNPLPGQVVAVLVEVGIGSGGDLNVYNSVGTINIAMDIEGYVDSTSPGMFNPTTPTRICDTRASGGGIPSNQCNNSSPGAHPLGPNGVLSFVVSELREPGAVDRRDRGRLQPHRDRPVGAHRPGRLPGQPGQSPHRVQCQP